MLGILPGAGESTYCDTIGEVIEELVGPQIQIPGILEENPDVTGCLLEVHRLKSFLEEIAQSLRR